MIKVNSYGILPLMFRERVNKTTCMERMADMEGDTVAIPHLQVYHLLLWLHPPHNRWTTWVTWATWAIWATWTRNHWWCPTAGQQISLSSSSNTVSRFVHLWNFHGCLHYGPDSVLIKLCMIAKCSNIVIRCVPPWISFSSSLRPQWCQDLMLSDSWTVISLSSNTSVI